MTVLRHGHLRSAPVVVDVGVRTEREPPTLRAALYNLHSQVTAPPLWHLSSPATYGTRQVQKVARDAECVRPRSSRILGAAWTILHGDPATTKQSRKIMERFLRPGGLHTPLRHHDLQCGQSRPATQTARCDYALDGQKRDFSRVLLQNCAGTDCITLQSSPRTHVSSQRDQRRATLR